MTQLTRKISNPARQGNSTFARIFGFWIRLFDAIYLKPLKFAERFDQDIHQHRPGPSRRVDISENLLLTSSI
jgi:hypothetical protein